MPQNKIAVIILAAGKGTRMKSSLPKVLHPVAGRSMVHHVLALAENLQAERTAVVVGNGAEQVSDAVAPAPCYVQEPQLGTAHAVLAAREALEDFDGDVLILYGDTPLVREEILAEMIAARQANADPAVVVMGVRFDDPGAYGRLITGDNGELLEIVEFKDANAEQRAVTLCNAGLMCLDGKRALALLDAVDDNNAAGEFYLTDVVKLARQQGWTCAVVEGTVEDAMGVNSRVELAQAEAVMQQRLRHAAMVNGATLTAPETVFFSHDTVLGKDVVLQPHVFFGPGVTVGDGVTIKAYSHLEDCTVEGKADIGPYARLRPGALIQEGARVGNFVEIKKAVVEQGAKVNHLTYIGDARVGKNANVGAGTITCNYDGFNKSFTDIGEGAFIGSNTALVAPVKIGDGAVIGAGSTIAKDVEADALAVTRAPQKGLAGWAAAHREKNSK